MEVNEIEKSKGDYSFKKVVGKFQISDKLIGRGSYGEVYVAKLPEDTSKLFAVKVSSLLNITERKKEIFERELTILSTLIHPNIVKFHQFNRSKRNIYLFFDYCNEGDLEKYLAQRGQYLSESEALHLIKQFIEAFKYLYANSVIHRDIKPANILLHDGVLKVADFGFSKVRGFLIKTPLIIFFHYFSTYQSIDSLSFFIFEDYKYITIAL
jgi:serine/threonine protein kinase